MAWPTAGDLRAKYPALAEVVGDDPLTEALEEALYIDVLSRVGELYDTDGFGGNTPPALFQAVLVYGYAAWKRKPHAGARASASDRAVAENDTRITKVFESICNGFGTLFDETGKKIKSKRAAGGTKKVYKRIEPQNTVPDPSLGFNVAARPNESEWRR